jgi:hypothetical protein
MDGAGPQAVAAAPGSTYDRIVPRERDWSPGGRVGSLNLAAAVGIVLYQGAAPIACMAEPDWTKPSPRNPEFIQSGLPTDIAHWITVVI